MAKSIGYYWEIDVDAKSSCGYMFLTSREVHWDSIKGGNTETKSVPTTGQAKH